MPASSAAEPAASNPVLRLGSVVAVASLAWGGVVFGSFQYDDYANILTHASTMQSIGLGEQLATGIRPLTRLSYALCASIFGTWAGGWLTINLLLHVLSAVGVTLLAQARGVSSRAAMLAGCCFALLPTHGAVVAYVSGRSTGLAVTLMIASLLAYTRTVQARSTSTQRGFQLLAVTLFVLACAAKEVALVLPALVLLWERCSPQLPSWRESCRRALPFMLTAAVMLVTIVIVPRYRELLAFSCDLRSPLESLWHNVIAWPMTIRLWFTPWDLSIEHPAPLLTSTTIALAVATFGALISAALLHRAYPTLALAMGWPFIAMLPTHSVVAKLDAVSEGSLYVAALGPAIALGVLADRWSSTRGTYPAKAAIAMVALVATALCAWRVHIWSDPVRLWQEATVHAPASSRAWTNLGMAYLKADEPLQARIALLQAQRLEPANVQVMLNLELLATLND